MIHTPLDDGTAIGGSPPPRRDASRREGARDAGTSGGTSGGTFGNCCLELRCHTVASHLPLEEIKNESSNLGSRDGDVF